MSSKLDKTWHLADDSEAVAVTEFEFQLWRVFYSFLKWQEDCQLYIGNDPLTGYELALLHIVRMKERPKTIYEISRLLNRDDPNNVQYSLGKLIKLGLIEKVKLESTKKALSYQVTAKGIKNTDAYQDARQDILLKLFKDTGIDSLQLETVARSLNSARSLYDEASRLAASYRNEDLI